MLQLSKKTHNDLLNQWQTNPEFVKAYDELADEIALLDECIKPPEWNSFSFKAVRLKKIAPTGSITSVKLASFNIRGWHKSVEAVGRN